MTVEEAYDELGLISTAKMSDVYQAYKSRGREKTASPDPDDPEVVETFRRAEVAYQLLKAHHNGVRSSSLKSAEGAAPGNADRSAHSADDDKSAVATVRGHMNAHGIVVLADGFLENVHHIKRPTTASEFKEYLTQTDVSPTSMVDDILLEDAAGLSRTMVATAVRKVISEDTKARSNVIFTPLLTKVAPDDQALAMTQLLELTTQIFKGPPRLMAYGLLQFVWQVHRKTLGYPVQHHLMPVIWSAAQGTGKSTFVRHLCGPLKELFSPPITMEDYIDSRFSSALDYAVLFVDEIPALTPLQVDALKCIITGEELLRRQLGTSKKVRVRQKSTTIGTANGAVEQYFPDPSGHRRFLSMELADGRKDEGIWSAIERFDYERLWRMVGATDQAPILEVLDALRQFQAGNAPMSPLLTWLIDLDFGSRALKGIRKSDGYRANDLRELFNEAMGVDWSRQRFSNEMENFFSHDLTPFGGKRVVNGNSYYRLKRQ